MHFQEEIERDKSVVVDTVLLDQGKYLIFGFFLISLGFIVTIF